MNIRYRVDLTVDERDELKRLLSAGKCSARRLKRAQILGAVGSGAGPQQSLYQANELPHRFRFGSAAPDKRALDQRHRPVRRRGSGMQRCCCRTRC
jgi:hypothetical protein